MKLVRKWNDPYLATHLKNGRPHAGVSTDLKDHVMLINEKDIVIYDFNSDDQE